MSSVHLELTGIGKRFGTFRALEDVSLAVARGEFVTLLGPSGCGKTTLLRVIAGLEVPDGGTVTLERRDVTELPAAHRGCGIVFQSYALFPNLTALANVAYGMLGVPAAVRTARALDLLKRVHLDGLADRFPSQLSGGQQQRVALARALAIKPQLLLLDEPLSALDAKVRAHLRVEIRALQRDLGLTTIMVTHDQEEALTMSDRVVVMHEGRIVQTATPAELYAHPATAFVAGFVGRINLLDGWNSDGNGRVEWGSVRLALGRPAPPGPIRIAIRPEHLCEAAADGPNVVAARVRFVEFRGSNHQIALELDDGLELAWEVGSAWLGGRALREGETLRIHLPPAHLRAFPATEPVAAA